MEETIARTEKEGHKGRTSNFSTTWNENMAHLAQQAIPLHEQARRTWLRMDVANLGRKIMNPLHFLALVAVLGVAGVVNTVYTPAYMVWVDGVPLGTVAEQTTVQAAVERVEGRVSSILGYDYQLEQTITYESTLVEKGTMPSELGFDSYFYNSVGVIQENYVLTIDGEVYAIGADRTDMDAMLEAIQAPYITEDTVAVDFLADVAITQELMGVTEYTDLEEVNAILTANTSGQTSYEVQSGDTFMAIAYANGMDMTELEALNPDVDINWLHIGQLLNIKQEVPFLSVVTTEAVTYYEDIASPVEEVADDTMYQGESSVIDAGTLGEAFVSAEVIYVNGYENERNVVESVTVTEPTTKVLAVGTMARPTWYPTGSYIWPTYGTISSYFGYRTIFGSTSYHSGLDIAASYGNAIMAADGGTVTWSGMGSGSNWSYGNYVIIDHGNGVQTIYAHCSSLLVSVGDKVYQGQTIARVGSTGRSTGNHCHFEIRINGTAVNPLQYLP